MESDSGVSGEKELNENGTPVEILEGDEDDLKPEKWTWYKYEEMSW